MGWAVLRSEYIASSDPDAEKLGKKRFIADIVQEGVIWKA